METHVKVCSKFDWVMFFKEEDYERLREAWYQGIWIELDNLFGTREVVDGKNIAAMFISTPEGRAKYEELEKILKTELEAMEIEEEKEEWET